VIRIREIGYRACAIGSKQQTDAFLRRGLYNERSGIARHREHHTVSLDPDLVLEQKLTQGVIGDRDVRRCARDFAVRKSSRPAGLRYRHIFRRSSETRWRAKLKRVVIRYRSILQLRNRTIHIVTAGNQLHKFG
jgi:hypothetical protein